MTTSLILKDLTLTIFAGEGMDEHMKQAGPVFADCWIEQGRVTRVVCPDGIDFVGPTGRLSRPESFDVTDLCDLTKLARDIKADEDERRELEIHAHA